MFGLMFPVLMRLWRRLLLVLVLLLLGMDVRLRMLGLVAVQ